MENHIKYSKAVSWFNDCRIPFVDNDKPKGGFGAASIGYGNEYEYDGRCNEANTQGRFPANLLVSDDMLNDGVITKTTASKGHIRKGNVIGDNRTPVAAGLFGDGNWIEGTNINDKGTNSRYYDIDKWFDNLIE